MTDNDIAAAPRASRTSKAAARAAEIKAEAAKYGLTVTAKVSLVDAVVTVEGRFTPGDAKAYIAAEDNANTLLGMIRMVRPGSVWGTDSASVGGYVGLTHGYVRLHKSGCEIRVARHLTQEKPPATGDNPAARSPRKTSGPRPGQQGSPNARGRR